MKSFKELYEAKQVGYLYHFTKVTNLVDILDSKKQSELGLEIFEFLSHNSTFSCTRNACLAQSVLSKDINLKNGYHVRIVLDGNKISNKFKISPISGFDDTELKQTKYNKRIGKEYGEQEEKILPDKRQKERTKTFKMKDYIIQIDFSNEAKEDVNRDLLKKLDKYNIKYNFVKKFHTFKESKDYSPNQSNHELELSYDEI